MAHQNETTIHNKERYFMVDLLRLISMIAISTFHIHEAAFYSNSHNHFQHGIFDVLICAYARFFSFSGFTIVLVSYFMIGLLGLNKEKFKKILITSVVGVFALLIIFFEAESWKGQWDIYHFIAVSTVVVLLLSRHSKTLYFFGALSFVALLIPPDFWIIKEFEHFFWYNPVFGSYAIRGSGSWPLLPWIGLAIGPFSIGHFLLKNPNFKTKLNSVSPIESIFWILVLALSIPAWGAFYPVPIGSDFYKFVQSMPRYPWFANMTIAFLFVRLGFVSKINQFASSTTYLSWISRLYLNKKFFFFYIVNWMVIGLFSNFVPFYLAYWPTFDIVLLSLYPISEFLCRCLLSSLDAIRGRLSPGLRAAP